MSENYCFNNSFVKDTQNRLNKWSNEAYCGHTNYIIARNRINTYITLMKTDKAYPLEFASRVNKIISPHMLGQ